MLVQSIFDPLHAREHFLLLQPPADNLHRDGEAVTRDGVVVLVRASRDAVELAEFEFSGKCVASG